MKEFYVLGVLGVALISAVFSAKPLSYDQYRTTLTAEGCAWALANKIDVQRDAQTCTAIVRLRPHSFSEGGYVLLNNDRAVDTTSSLILSSERLEEDVLPDTPGQNGAIKRIELIVFIALMAIVFIVVFFKRREAKKEKHETR